jgi:hypothetical protein
VGWIVQSGSLSRPLGQPKIGADEMTLHLFKMAGITAVTVLCIFSPFLPGKYDPFAVPLSTTAQLLGAAGLLLVPIGVLWLTPEMVRRLQRNRIPPNPRRGYHFAVASLTAASVLVIAVSLIVLFGVSTSLGILILALWFYTASRWIPKLLRLKTAEAESIHPAPLYLIIIPLAVLLFQVVLAAPLTEFSRNRAIANSAEFVSHIERYRAEYGRYPVTLVAMWKDYYPDVVGVEKFHYAPYGGSYNLFFEQPRLLFDNIGTREWVVYNPADDQRMFSHTAWFLLLTPEELERSQGWYAVHDAKVPHWKCFWFD